MKKGDKAFLFNSNLFIVLASAKAHAATEVEIVKDNGANDLWTVKFDGKELVALRKNLFNKKNDAKKEFIKQLEILLKSLKEDV